MLQFNFHFIHTGIFLLRLAISSLSVPTSYLSLFVTKNFFYNPNPPTQGGTSDLFCLPDNPQYLTYRPGVQGYSPLHGAEYKIEHDTLLPLPGVHQDNAPCAVCVNCQRKVVLTIPARTTLPSLQDNSGYLMTECYSHRRREAACLNKNPEAVCGEAASTDGTLFYHTEAVCNGIDCPPYDPEKELTCVVCTK